MKALFNISLLLLMFTATGLNAQLVNDENGGTYLYKNKISNEDTLLYRIMYPNDFDEAKKYPLVVFFHGMGERGSDNQRQLAHGSKLFRDSLNQYPAIVIFPQCPETDYWANLYRPDKGGAKRKFDFYYNENPNPTMEMVIALVAEFSSKKFVDKARIYSSGLSMGGMGTFEFAYRLNDKIACAMPICGGGPTSKAEGMTDVPFWIFHGLKDDVVHPRYSMMMMKAIQQAGGKSKITLFPEANHNSWDPAFADTDFLRWMFDQKRVF